MIVLPVSVIELFGLQIIGLILIVALFCTLISNMPNKSPNNGIYVLLGACMFYLLSNLVYYSKLVQSKILTDTLILVICSGFMAVGCQLMFPWASNNYTDSAKDIDKPDLLIQECNHTISGSSTCRSGNESLGSTLDLELVHHSRHKSHKCIVCNGVARKVQRDDFSKCKKCNEEYKLKKVFGHSGTFPAPENDSVIFHSRSGCIHRKLEKYDFVKLDDAYTSGSTSLGSDSSISLW
jgi:hypothetical protein